jgi:hypothetical protein
VSEADRYVGEQKLNWSELDQMSDRGVAALVDSAIFVLKQSDVGGPAPTEMPASVMTKALEQLLAERGADAGAAGKVVKQAELSRPIALALLSAIATEPALAQEIERVWRERGGLLFVGVDVILSAALLLLVLKLKKVKVNKDGVVVILDKLSTGAISNVFKLVGS